MDSSKNFVDFARDDICAALAPEIYHLQYKTIKNVRNKVRRTLNRSMTLAEKIEPLPGWCNAEKAQRLFDLVIQSDSKLTVELGVFGGRSFIPFALAHKQKQSGFALGIDPYKKEAAIEGSNSPENNEWWSKLNLTEIYRRAIYDIQLNDADEFCSLIRMKSQDAGILFADNIIDILHQDSNHNQQTIILELDLWISKLKINGYWIADDVQWVEAKDSYSKLPEYGLELFEDYKDWQIWKKIK